MTGVHCWEDNGKSLGGDGESYGESATCLLPDGHDGPHEFTPDSEIMVTFVEVPA